MNRRVTALQVIAAVTFALGLDALALAIGLAAPELTPLGTMAAAAVLVGGWVGLGFWLFPPERRSEMDRRVAHVPREVDLVRGQTFSRTSVHDPADVYGGVGTEGGRGGLGRGKYYGLKRGLVPAKCEHCGGSGRVATDRARGPGGHSSRTVPPRTGGR